MDQVQAPDQSQINSGISLGARAAYLAPIAIGAIILYLLLKSKK